MSPFHLSATIRSYDDSLRDKRKLRATSQILIVKCIFFSSFRDGKWETSIVNFKPWRLQRQTFDFVSAALSRLLFWTIVNWRFFTLNCSFENILFNFWLLWIDRFTGGTILKKREERRPSCHPVFVYLKMQLDFILFFRNVFVSNTHTYLTN